MAKPGRSRRSSFSERAGSNDRSPRPLASRRGPAPGTGAGGISSPLPSLVDRLARHRGAILALVVAALVLGGAGWVLVAANQPAYACATLWDPSPAPGGDQLGSRQLDMGNQHVPFGTQIRYSYCPPASGRHYPSPGGPIDPRFYGPNDAALPGGWVHNLEHGALVVLYSCSRGGCDDTDLASLRTLVANFPASPVCGIPPGVVGPVVARFDEMTHPFAALVWDYVLFQDRLDTNQILQFFQARAERANPEPQCAPSPSPSSSPAASGTTPSPSP